MLNWFISYSKRSNFFFDTSGRPITEIRQSFIFNFLHSSLFKQTNKYIEIWPKTIYL